jgi:hypothetical protein
LANSPRQLNVNCTISAIYLPETGSLAAYYARYRQLKDLNRTLPSTFYNSIEGDQFSTNLSSLTTGSGGVIPTINSNIGAPACTFYYGSIEPGVAHPVLNLLKGPKKSSFGPQVYQIPSNAKSGQTRTLSTNIAQESTTNLYSLANPFIPFTFDKNSPSGPYSTAQVRTTYNVWLSRDINLNNVKVTKGIGIVNFKEIGTSTNPKPASITTQYSKDGSRVVVHSQNKSAILRRMFPIADDLIYNNTDEEEATLYYPNSNTVETPPGKIKAKGGKNCGFRINMNHDEFSSFQTTLGNVNSSIWIYFGYPTTDKSKKVISEFVLVLDLGKPPILRYKKSNSAAENNTNSISKDWEKIELDDVPVITKFSKNFEFYVHFAGPNMYFGFEPNISKWYVFEPIKVDENKKDQSYDDFYLPSIPKESIIEILFRNVHASFTYEPICFNNFNSDYVGADNTDARNRININFVSSKADYLDGSVSEETLNKTLREHRVPPFSNKLIYSKNELVVPTYYADYRMNRGDTNLDTDIAEEDYAINPEIIYQEVSAVLDESIPDNPRYFIDGQVVYDTTIEGPVFFYVREFKKLDQRRKITRAIWNQYSDVSKYLTEVTLGEKFDLKNKSYKKSEAVLTFANLTNDVYGMQILNAMQENYLVFNLKAGYGNESYSYFQGYTKKVEVTRSPDSFIIKVTCGDLGSQLLDDIIFNTTSPISFATRSFKGILEDSFYMAGLQGVYVPREKAAIGYDILHDKYFNLYVGAFNLQQQASLANNVLTVNKKTQISDTVREIMDNMIYSAKDPTTNLPMEYYPVLYWNPQKEIYELKMRTDTPVDELYFAGDTSDPNGLQLMANSNPDKQHGIINQTGWKETTDLVFLASRLTMVGRLATMKPFVAISENSVVNKAVGATAFDNLNNFIRTGNDPNEGNVQDQDVLGYIGFNKEKYDDEEKLYQSENILRTVFDAREKNIRVPLHKLEFSVFVTKPLNTHGTFKIKSFYGGTEVSETSQYMYVDITYKFDINKNLITANVIGQIAANLFE